MNDLKKLKIEELREIARSNKCPGYLKLKKRGTCSFC